MTHREAVQTALRELGIDEVKIARALENADKNAGLMRGYLQIPAGDERKLIDEIKARHAQFAAMGPEGRKEVHERARQEFLAENKRN